MADDLASILELEPPEAAPRLIGSVISHEIDGEVVRGVITETEAYTIDDAASHSFRGESVRNAPMFGAAGDLYVYLSYGVHYCLNIVTGKKKGGAVLIRGVLISDGLRSVWHRRYHEALPLNLPTARFLQLTNGPGKVAQAFGVDMRFNRMNILDPESPIRLSLQPGEVMTRAIQTPRVGITKNAHVPWRWIMETTE
jgi:DNA-3-methyladenine glycosylase